MCIKIASNWIVRHVSLFELTKDGTPKHVYSVPVFFRSFTCYNISLNAVLTSVNILSANSFT
jgi:hypothetical protein